MGRPMNVTKKYDLQNIKNTIEFMKPFFDAVRLVDTSNTTVITFDDDTRMVREKEHCYQIWNKECRCENCISMAAVLTDCEKSKYEFLDGDIYHVLSKPVVVYDEEGKEHKVVMEIFNGVTDDVLFQKIGEKNQLNLNVSELMKETYRKVYEDPLTMVYNRRYFDEYIYLYRNNDSVSKKIGFIMADLTRFKEINDTMGHDIGDRILVEVARTLMNNVDPKDSIIRFGGDEFLVVLVDCAPEIIRAKMEVLQKEVNKICYNEQEQSYVDVDMGYSFTEEFEPTKDFVKHMLKEADEAMYILKKSRKKTEGNPRCS